VAHDVERDAEVVTANLVDAGSLGAAMKDVDMVVHCAALTTNNAPWSLHEETNVEGTRAVYDQACEAGVKRMVHVSSVIVYGLEAPNGAPVAESAPLPSEPDRWGYYQRSKLGAEQTLAGANGNGPGVVIVRPGIIYGPGAEGPVKRGLVQLGSVRLTIGDGNNHLPLTYVDNVVDGILLALTSADAAGETYNLVDDPQPTVRSAALKAAEVQGEETKLVPLPTAMLSRLARMLERKRERAEAKTPPRLSRFQIASATRDVVYDAGKARRELGWEPGVGLDEGLRRTFD
jgi:2-alkyl-3-oxoalkanoate reductase